MLYELKKVRKASGVSQVEAAERFGVPLSTYRNWEQCKNMPRDNSTIKEMADYFGVSMEALFGYDMVEPGAFADLPEYEDSRFRLVPMFGRIAAGTPIAMEGAEDHIPVPREVMARHPRAFLLRVDGESMNRVLPNGCYALVDPDDKEPVDNRAYAVCVNGYDATVKRVRRLANGFELAPDSTDPTYRPMVYDYGVEGTDEITVIGRVFWYTLPFDWTI